MNARSNFLSLILLDALEDENKNDVYATLSRNDVDTSYVAQERGIAPLHYAAGMENELLAVEFTTCFLENGAKNVDVTTNEGMTPLHVAALHGRANITRLLLQHGANVDIQDTERKTAIHYAIEGSHFEVVQVLRDHIYRAKKQKKRKQLEEQQQLLERQRGHLTPERLSPPCSSGSNTKHNTSPRYYNYDTASPYYIYITHRRHTPQPRYPPRPQETSDERSQEEQVKVNAEQPSKNNVQSGDAKQDDIGYHWITTEPHVLTVPYKPKPVNVFDLTRENLREMCYNSVAMERTRRSLIEMWREKVRRSRARQSLLRQFDNVGEMVDDIVAADNLNFTNTALREPSEQTSARADNTEPSSSYWWDDADRQSLQVGGNNQGESVSPNMSLGTLIQQMAKAHVVDPESEPRPRPPTPPKAFPPIPPKCQTMPSRRRRGNKENVRQVIVPRRRAREVQNNQENENLLQVPRGPLVPILKTPPRQKGESQTTSVGNQQQETENIEENASKMPTPQKRDADNSNVLKTPPNNTNNLQVPKVVTDGDGDGGASTDSSYCIRSPKTKDYFVQLAESYVHTDDENGLVFYETRLLSNVGNRVAQTREAKQGNVENEALEMSVVSQSTNFTVPLDYETDALRAELTKFGEPPGPITKSTKRLYIKRLIRYKRKTPAALQEALRKQGITDLTEFSVELYRTLKNLESFERIVEYMKFETQSSHFFANHQFKRQMREGHLKQSFIYMLIDPRISSNLPGESVFLDKFAVWKRFLQSVFYVGKGKTSRPYSHLYDAMKTHSRLNGQQANQEKVHPNKLQMLNADLFKSPPKQPSNSKKLNRILDIWRNSMGVVCLHVFHNIVPTEAYTREAAIIDALSLHHLTNMKRGDYYGPAQTWTMREKKYFGIALLYKAMQIYLAEGESQLSPSDLI